MSEMGMLRQLTPLESKLAAPIICLCAVSITICTGSAFVGRYHSRSPSFISCSSGFLCHANLMPEAWFSASQDTALLHIKKAFAFRWKRWNPHRSNLFRRSLSSLNFRRCLSRC